MLPLFLSCFNPIFFILADIDDMHGSSEEFEFSLIGPPTADVAALERLKNIPINL